MRKQKIAYKGTTKIANMQIFLYFLIKKVRVPLKKRAHTCVYERKAVPL